MISKNRSLRVHCNEHVLLFVVDLNLYDRLLFISMNTKELGDLIKKRRASLQIDQRTLSEISGVAVHTLSNIEAGGGNPTVATLDRVLDALGMELHIQVKQ